MNIRKQFAAQLRAIQKSHMETFLGFSNIICNEFMILLSGHHSPKPIYTLTVLPLVLNHVQKKKEQKNNKPIFKTKKFSTKFTTVSTLHTYSVSPLLYSSQTSSSTPSTNPSPSSHYHSHSHLQDSHHLSFPSSTPLSLSVLPVQTDIPNQDNSVSGQMVSTYKFLSFGVQWGKKNNIPKVVKVV